MFYIAVAFLVGTLIPLQAILNARLGVLLEHHARSAFVNFAVGTGFYLIVLAATVGLPSLRTFGTVPWYYYLGGLLGSCFVSSAIWLVPKIGAASFLSLLVTGQMLISVYLDHVGAFGIARNPAGSARLVGILLLIAGVGLIVRK